MALRKHATAIAVLLFMVTYAVLGVVATQLDLTRGGKPNHFGFWSAVVIGALMVTLMLAVGWAAKGRPDGVIIDGKNRVTLGHFQLVVWTLVVLSSYAGAVFTNLMADKGFDALKVTVPPELWLAIGISGTSFVGSKAIKKTMQADLATKAAPANADWADMFTSDVKQGQGSVDLSKLQMFFFTVVLAFAYAATVGNALLNTTGPIEGLPPLDKGFVTLLAISSGGYLTRKAAHKIG
jgi:hypothetical protein